MASIFYEHWGGGGVGQSGWKGQSTGYLTKLFCKHGGFLFRHIHDRVYIQGGGSHAVRGQRLPLPEESPFAFFSLSLPP